ncbi:hypothetical protein [Flavobacterium rhizosphaerae]|uniref:DUF1269 domain-containing protein n=1 Tax=Flavobacterium rhizosphaerae TaxID=3163298 RepID=A0ABW8YVR6_9FLAO
MEQKVAVFNSYKEALEALKELKQHDFPMKDVSLVGKAGIVDDEHIHLDEVDKATNIPAYVGMGAGTVVGLLTGLGVFAIPGFGMLYGAGALVGAIAGVDVGMIGGGFASLVAKLFTNDKHVENIKEHIEAGKFVLVVSGDKDEIAVAKEILSSKNLHSHFYE